LRNGVVGLGAIASSARHRETHATGFRALSKRKDSLMVLEPLANQIISSYRRFPTTIAESTADDEITNFHRR
jgi:hypothetical protein